MKPQFMRLHLCPGAEPDLIAGKDAFDQAVKAEFLKIVVIRLHSHPAVVVEHIRLLSVAVHQFHQAFPEVHNKTVYKGHIIQLRLVGGIWVT